MAWRHGFAVGLSIGFGVACGGSKPSAEAPSVPASASPAAPSVVQSAAPVESAPSPPPAPSAEASAAAPVKVEPVAPICMAKCEKLVARCGKTAVDTCKLNCSKYEPPPSECLDQVRAALECARDAKDLTCANVAPESCSGKFREIAKCNAGEAPAPTAGPKGLPEGWEKVNDAANGFSIAMPSGSTEKAGPEGPVRSVTAADGTMYTVSVLPLLKEKPSEKSLLHFLMKVQGRCSDKVKLDGFVEKEGRSSIHYTAHCPDKTDWNGMIYISAKNLFLLSAQAPAGKIGITEPFFYEFELTKP